MPGHRDRPVQPAPPTQSARSAGPGRRFVPSTVHPSVRAARHSHDDPAGEVVRWAAFSCLLVPVVLVVYGTSFGGAAVATLGLAAVTAACRALLRHSEKAERAAARIRSEEAFPSAHRGRHSRSGAGSHRGCHSPGPLSPHD
ncbi:MULTISPECIES: hypothetical protein [unclassified Streptomyces]|uniref:hypothetical protein n=1 Tax=unclassified Streptomyces TaxID=2593676 RepID=UPI002E351A31|nr:MULTISPECIES: hypothetical protein [unclassified Streptomyces]WUC66357.1 hypothetical protein OG861_20185 [Streptomyces sp. NBC_00539]